MSKIRTPTISPNKQATKDVTKIYYQSPLDKQFIMFSLVQKQSSMGITSNERLLLFNSQDKSLRYYSSVPIPLPDTSKPLPDAKQIIYIKKVRNFQFKATKTGIGKVSVKWSDLNGEGGSKKIWSLKFQNNTIMTKWIMDVAQAIKDGHYKTDNRPKTERRQTKPNIDKYMTPFIAQTGGIQSRRNSSSKSNFINSSSDSNQKWLSELVKKKQEQINYNHTNLSMVSKSDSEEKKQKLQNIKSEQKKYQTAEKVSDNDRDFLKSIKFNSNTPISKLPQKIPVIIEQDESKFSKRSQLQLNNSQSTKNFRINRPLPDQINQLSQDVESSHIRNLQDSILQNKVKSDQEYLSNFINQLRKQPQYDLAEASSYQPIKPTFFSQFQKYEFKEPQQEWLNPSKFYPYLYSQFIKISQQISKKIIQNLPTFLDEARRVPSEALYATQSQIFVTIKSIQFSIPIAPVLNSFEAQLKMHQYSSIVGYIKRKSQNDKFPHNKYTTVLPIPFCMVEYQWYQIKCKAIIPKSYPKIPQEQAITIDKYFGIPNLLWIYHGFDSVLVVDFAVKGLTINSQIQQNVLEQAATKLLQQQISICHIKDLSEYCYSHFKFKLNPKVIKLILNKILQINSKIGPIINVLISLLYAIKCSEYIKDQLLSKLYIISEGQIYEMITGFIKILATQRNTTFANKILLSLTQQLKLSHFDIQFQIQDYVVYSSLIFLLALHVENVGRNKEDTFKFHPIPYTYNAQCLSKQMEQLEQILKMSQVQNWSEERRGKGFEKITEILKKFQYLWMEAQDNQFHFQQYKSVGNYKSRRNSNFQRINSKSANSVSRNQKLKYFNNYYQLMHYQSLYKPYAPTLMSLDSFNSSDTYNLELEQLVSENPPTYFSYLIGINCIKWVSKKGNTNHEVVEKMVYDQITNSRKWCGNFSPVSLMYYQLWAIYNEQIFNIQTAIQYARYTLQVVIQLYGDDSAEAAQRWFLLGNIMMEGSLYEQALQAYLKSLRVLKSFQIINQSSLSASRDTLLKWNEKTDDAQLTIRSKMIKIYLSMGKLEQCIDQCSLGLLTCQNLTNHNSNTELQILSTIIRCCQLRKQSSKAQTMIQTVSIQFGNRIHQLCSNEGPSSGFSLQMLQQQEQLRQNMIKICLSPAIAFRITDRIRKLYLLKITKAIRGKYEGRHNKRQYNRYLTKNAYISLQNNDSEQPPNIINWFLFYLQNIPMYSTNMKFRQRNSYPLQGIDINYSLYQNALGSKILPVTQPKILIPALRAIQVFCGIVGFSYIEGCLLD